MTTERALDVKLGHVPPGNIGNAGPYVAILAAGR